MILKIFWGYKALKVLQPMTMTRVLVSRDITYNASEIEFKIHAIVMFSFFDSLFGPNVIECFIF